MIPGPQTSQYRVQPVLYNMATNCSLLIQISYSWGCLALSSPHLRSSTVWWNRRGDYIPTVTWLSSVKGFSRNYWLQRYLRIACMPVLWFLLFSLVPQMVKNACNAGDLGLIPGVGKIPWGRELQYSCLGNSMDRGAWRATVRGVAKSWTQLSNFHFSLETPRKTDA